VVRQSVNHRAQAIESLTSRIRQNLADFAADAVVDLMAHELRRREENHASRITKLTPVSAAYIRARRKLEVRKTLVRSTEHVSDATHRMDERNDVAAVDLAAQAADVRLDDRGIGIEVHIHTFSSSIVRVTVCPHSSANTRAGETPGQKFDGPPARVTVRASKLTSRSATASTVSIAKPGRRRPNAATRANTPQRRRLHQIIVGAGIEPVYRSFTPPSVVKTKWAWRFRLRAACSPA